LSFVSIAAAARRFMIQMAATMGFDLGGKDQRLRRGATVLPHAPALNPMSDGLGEAAERVAATPGLPHSL
jgi:hypothetical protein